MNPELPRHALDRADAELVLATQLLEQFPLRPPVHAASRTKTTGRGTLGHTESGGPTFVSTRGPSFGSKASPSMVRSDAAPAIDERPFMASGMARPSGSLPSTSLAVTMGSRSA